MLALRKTPLIRLQTIPADTAGASPAGPKPRQAANTQLETQLTEFRKEARVGSGL